MTRFCPQCGERASRNAQSSHIFAADADGFCLGLSHRSGCKEHLRRFCAETGLRLGASVPWDRRIRLWTRETTAFVMVLPTAAGNGHRMICKLTNSH